MIAELERVWSRTRAARDLPPPRRVAMLKTGDTPYPHPASPIVILLFADGRPAPGAVAKVARIAAGDAGVEAEAAGLERVRSRLPPELAASVPEFWAQGRINGRAFVLSSAVEGDVEAHHAWRIALVPRATRRIAAALDWSARFTAALPAAPIDAATWLGALEPALGALGGSGLDARQMAALAPRLAGLWYRPWPAAAAHGDFFPGNVLFGKRDRVAVVDWGTATLRAPIFVDALSYEASFALQMLHDRGAVDANALGAVHALAPFAALRRRLAAAGVDCEPGGDARLLGCVAATLSELRAGVDRAASAQRWSRLVALELEAGSPG